MMAAARWALIGGIAAALSACVPSDAARAPVLGGALVLGVPSGYCISRSASTEREDTASILMGRCSDSSPVPPAVIAVTVGRAGTASALTDPARLADYLQSQAGRKSLSRAGRAADVRIAEIRGRGDALLVRLTDRRVGEYWRAVTGSAGRLVSISVLPPDRGALSPDQGRVILDRTLDATARAAVRTP